MLIRVINPNTSESMTRGIAEQAQSAQAPDTRIITVNPAMGPVSIESHYDEVVAAVGVLDEIRKGEAAGTDAYVIACFGDPGLLAAREAAQGPVIGIAEAAMHVASLLATGFSVVTTLERTCIQAEHLVHRYGMQQSCRGIHGTDIPVLDLECIDEAGFEHLAQACARALRQDRSAAIVLGCAGLGTFEQRLQERLEVPVIDGVRAGVRLAEMLVRLGLKTSKKGDLAPPIPKVYTGMMAAWSWQSN